jgi:hypothetical protein
MDVCVLCCTVKAQKQAKTIKKKKQVGKNTKREKRRNAENTRRKSV